MGRSRVRSGGWVLIGGLLAGGTAHAQGPTTPIGLPEPQSTGLASRPLLQEPAVQRDLKLTGVQRERLADLDAEAGQLHQGLTNPGEEEFDFAAMLGQARQVEQDRSRALGRILTAVQKHRLNQLDWQREGWRALARPEVAARLRLRPDQQAQVARIVDRLRRDEAGSVLASGRAEDTATGRQLRAELKPSNGFIDPTGGGFADGGPLHFSTEGLAAQEQRHAEANSRLGRDAAREVNEVLTDAQRAAFVDLLGPRFDFSTLGRDIPAAGTGPDRTGRDARAKHKK